MIRDLGPASRHIALPNQFVPRWYQLPYMRFFTDGGSDGRGRVAVNVIHRRGGKDLMGMHTLAMLAHRRIGAYWHTFPTFEQGRKAIWEGFRSDGKRIVDNVFPAAIIKRRDNQQMMIELKCGSIYRVIGTDKIETVGAGPVGVLHSEYSIAKPRAADMIAPMLRENGGWESYLFTPRGRNHGKLLYDRIRAASERDPARYFCDLKTLYDTRAYDPDRTMQDERDRGRPEALIRQEYLCDWSAATVGAVWGDLIEQIEKEGRVCDLYPERDRGFEVWDLGGAGAHGDSTCFWQWSARNDGLDVLDYCEGHGKTFDYYADESDRRARENGVRIVKHWLPHDARAKHLSGASVVEMAIRRWGAENVGIYPEDSFLNGLQAARWLLQQNIRFHPRAAEGLEGLKAYHYDWDDDRKTLSNQPVHDWSSHPSDAFRGLALVARRSEEMTHPDERANVPIAMPVDHRFTLDDAWAQRDAERRWERD